MKKFLVIGSLAVVAALSMAADLTKSYKVSPRQATSIALKKYPGKVVGKVALENEEGKMQYSVNVRSGKQLREVMVDANTGKIANVEVTTKAEEAKEVAAEKKGVKKSHK